MDDALDRIWKRVEVAVKASGQRKVRVTYSAYGTDEEDEPIDNLDEVAVSGKVRLVAERETFFGGARSKAYRSPVLMNPTWLEVCVYANEMIKTTRDEHHCFLEGLQLQGQEEDVAIYEFCMGS